MLDESQLRKPGFSEGAAVVLGDGRAWRLPEPRPVFFPAFDEAKPDGDPLRIVTRCRLTFGKEFEADLKQAYGDESPADASGSAEVRIRTAARLLLLNYDLDADALFDLLPVRADDEAAAGVWDQINAVLSAVATRTYDLRDGRIVPMGGPAETAEA